MPGKLMVDWTASEVLPTTATELLVGLCTRVKALLGASAIIPAFGRDADKSTVNADIRSREASTILSTGAIPPVEADSGFEMIARNLIPLGTCLVLVGAL